MTDGDKADVLQASVEHYNRMLQGIIENPDKLKGTPSTATFKKVVGETWGAADCPLCQKFYTVNDGCGRCPVKEYYGGCSGTPHAFIPKAADYIDLYRTLIMERNVLDMMRLYLS